MMMMMSKIMLNLAPQRLKQKQTPRFIADESYMQWGERAEVRRGGCRGRQKRGGRKVTSASQRMQILHVATPTVCRVPTMYHVADCRSKRSHQCVTAASGRNRMYDERELMESGPSELSFTGRYKFRNSESCYFASVFCERILLKYVKRYECVESKPLQTSSKIPFCSVGGPGSAFGASEYA
ncbi:hypothetical protein EVAR_53998_1 [Eumeta japonica]|uniref:Uncharacterized protein n=1 Tax=Eumeta variegata TaxID=151549 RepID=A0A4C1YTB1_EUMVA|nr:hypothetical protein EVAR_53998_1 [Eumeta japonica]